MAIANNQISLEPTLSTHFDFQMVPLVMNVSVLEDTRATSVYQLGLSDGEGDVGGDWRVLY